MMTRLPWDILFVITDHADDGTQRVLYRTCRELRNYAARFIWSTFPIVLDPQNLSVVSWAVIFERGLEVLKHPVVRHHVKHVYLHQAPMEVPNSDYINALFGPFSEALRSTSVTTLELDVAGSVAAEQLFIFLRENPFPRSVTSLEISSFAMSPFTLRTLNQASILPYTTPNGQILAVEDEMSLESRPPGLLYLKTLRISAIAFLILVEQSSELRELILHKVARISELEQISISFPLLSSSITHLRIDRVLLNRDFVRQYVSQLPNLEKLFLGCSQNVFMQQYPALIMEVGGPRGHLGRLRECIWWIHLYTETPTVHELSKLFMEELSNATFLQVLAYKSGPSSSALLVIKMAGLVKWTDSAVLLVIENRRHEIESVTLGSDGARRTVEWKETKREVRDINVDYMDELWAGRL